MKHKYYRHHHKVVYHITHLPSAKFYVGQSKDFSSRIGDHISNILLGKHQLGSDTDLSQYQFSILHECGKLTDRERLKLERTTIKELSSMRPGLCVNVQHNKSI